MKASAVEKFHAAKRKQEASRAEFEAAFGRTDRIDDGLLRDLQALQMRFAAINARQHASSSHYGEPKVSRFVSQLGTMIGDISAHLATDRALQLFEPVRESDYIGYNGNTVGPRGLDEAALAEYEIVDDVRATANAEAEEIEDGPYEDDDEGAVPPSKPRRTRRERKSLRGLRRELHHRRPGFLTRRRARSPAELRARLI